MINKPIIFKELLTFTPEYFEEVVLKVNKNSMYHAKNTTNSDNSIILDHSMNSDHLTNLNNFADNVNNQTDLVGPIKSVKTSIPELSNQKKLINFKNLCQLEPFNRIIKSSTKGKQEQLEIGELNELESIDINKNIDSINVSYYFNFVGIIIVDHQVLLVYPKYFAHDFELSDVDMDSNLNSNLNSKSLSNSSAINTNDKVISNKVKVIRDKATIDKITIDDSNVNNSSISYPKFKQILRVIRTYNKKHQSNFKYYDDTYNNPVSSILEIALELLDYYFEYGLYNSNLDIFEKNGEGQINWDKTIEDCNSYLTNKNQPVYLDWYSYSEQEDRLNYFTRLHACILTKLSQEFADVISFFTDFHQIDLTTEELDSFGDNEYIISKIEKEISHQFITDKQHILYLLKAYLTETSKPSLESNISFFGTNNFNQIWEDVCQVVLLNVSNHSFNSIVTSLNKTNNLHSLVKLTNQQAFCNTPLKDLIHKPIWKISENQTQTNHNHISISQDTLIPDVISCKYIQDAKSNYRYKMTVYDAKYYNVIFTPSTIHNSKAGLKCTLNWTLNGNPGIGDVLKQYSYALSLQKLIIQFNQYSDFKFDESIENVFIFPYESSTNPLITIAQTQINGNNGINQVYPINTSSEVLSDTQTHIFGEVSLEFFSETCQTLKFEYRKASYMFEEYLKY